LSLATSKRVAALLESQKEKETVEYSGRIVKVSSTGTWQLRALLITNKAIYTLLPSNVSVCKRRIPIEKLGHITVSKISTEIVLHVPEEYDLRFQSFNKDEIMHDLGILFESVTGKALTINTVWDFFLNTVARTKFDSPIGTIADDDDDSSTSVAQSTGGTATLSSMTGAESKKAPGEELDENTRAHQLMQKKKMAAEEIESDEEHEHKESAEAQEEIKLDHPEDAAVSPSKRPKVNLESFDLLSVLGRGAFGKVMMVRKKDTGKIYAMKVLKKHYVFAKKQVTHTKEERNILSAAQHPFLMGLRFAFQSEHKLYLVMDFYQGGELFFHLQKVKRFTEEQARIIGGEVALALGHLHKLNFIYRDLKPENILMDDKGHVCLTDFGLSKQVNPENQFTKTMCGTPEYLPPEVLLGKEHGKAVDWWSYGVLLYELTIGMPPFMAKNHRDLYRKIQYAPIKFPKHTSEALKDLILLLLNREQETRLGSGPDDVNAIVRHPWFEGMNWEKLLKKEIEPLYAPPKTGSKSDLTGNFAEEFTDEPAIDSVVPESALGGVPGQDAHFDQWTFIGSAQGAGMGAVGGGSVVPRAKKSASDDEGSIHDDD